MYININNSQLSYLENCCQTLRIGMSHGNNIIIIIMFISHSSIIYKLTYSFQKRGFDPSVNRECEEVIYEDLLIIL